MQRIKPERRAKILAVAAKQFARRRYDEVTLDAIAADARIGKGTVYVYFRGKDDLYFTLVKEGVDELIAGLEERVSKEGGSGWRQLESIVTELVAFVKRVPHLLELMRSGAVPALDDQQIAHHGRLAAVIVTALKRGIKAGEIDDPRPVLTAQCILGYLRNVLLFEGRAVDEKVVREHLLRLLDRGVRVRKKSRR